MDERTRAFYADYATHGVAAESPRSAMLPHLLRWLPPGRTVLDVGAGAGRDVAALIDAGRPAWGLEPHDAMREQAATLFPVTRGRLRSAQLPDLGRPWVDERPQGFDAVVCSAVLMHIAPADLAAALTALLDQLDPAAEPQAARLFLAVPEMATDRVVAARDPDGRQFHNHDPAALQALLAERGLRAVDTAVNDAVLASTATRWHTLVLAQA